MSAAFGSRKAGSMPVANSCKVHLCGPQVASPRDGRHCWLSGIGTFSSAARCLPFCSMYNSLPFPCIRKKPRDLSSPLHGIILPVIFYRRPSKLQASSGVLSNSLAYTLNCLGSVSSQPCHPTPPTAAPRLTSPRCFGCPVLLQPKLLLCP